MELPQGSFYQMSTKLTDVLCIRVPHTLYVDKVGQGRTSLNTKLCRALILSHMYRVVVIVEVISLSF